MMSWHLFILTLSATLMQAPADFQAVDQAAFQRIVPKGARVQKLAGGLRFVEGPVWVNAPGGGYLVFSDLQANELKRWDPAGGLTTFRAPSGSSNGNTLDRQGRLVTAEHAGRVSRTEPMAMRGSAEAKKLTMPVNGQCRLEITFGLLVCSSLPLL